MKKILLLSILLMQTHHTSASAVRKDLGDIFVRMVTKIFYESVPMYLKHSSNNRIFSLQKNDCLYTEFNNEIYYRIKSSYNSDCHFKIGDEVSCRSINVQSLKHSFIHSQMHHNEEKTKNAEVLVSIYPQNTLEINKRTNTKFPLKWFCPLLESFFTPTLGLYRNKLATLNIWNAYDSLALTVINQNAEWDCFYGCSANKKTRYELLDDHFFPNPCLISDDEMVKNTAQHFKVSEESLHEYLSGGGTQLYIPTFHNQNDAIILNFGKLEMRNKKLMIPSYFGKKQNQHLVWDNNTTNLNMTSHLLDKEHNHRRINMSKLMLERNIITASEFFTINTYLLEYFKKTEYMYSKEDFCAIIEILNDDIGFKEEKIH